MLAIDPIQLQDAYADATTFAQATGLVAGYLIVSTNPAGIRLFRGEAYQEVEMDEFYAPPGVYSIEQGDTPIFKIQARNWIAGSNAVITGVLFAAIEPKFSAPQGSGADISPSGGVTPIASTVNIDHNGTRIASEPGINFVDDGVTWTTTDDPGNGVVKVLGELGYVTGALGGDVTLTAGNTYFTGPQIAIPAAGTYLVTGALTLARVTTAGKDTCKLWDGATVLASGETELAANGDLFTMALSGIYVAAGAATLRIAAATTSGANLRTIKAAAPDNGAGNTASVLTAVRIA